MGYLALHLTLTLISYNVVTNHGLESHLICKSVEDAFRSCAATVDYQRIEEVIENKINAKLASQLQEVREDLKQLNKTLLKGCNDGGSFMSNAPYSVILQSVDYQKASQLCASNGGKLADIRTVDEYYLIANLVRYKMSSSYVRVWLGMTYQPSTNSLFLSNGKAFTHELKWYPTFPRKDDSLHTSVLIGVRSAASSNAQGLINHHNRSSYVLEGVVCMK